MTTFGEEMAIEPHQPAGAARPRARTVARLLCRLIVFNVIALVNKIFTEG